MTSAKAVDHPSSFVIWGPDRGLLDSISFAIARGVGEVCYWFDIASPDGSLDPSERAVLERVPTERAFRVLPSAMRLQDEIGNMALWSMLRSDSSEPQTVPEVVDFVRIPDAIQKVLEGHDPATGPASVVVSNADHASHLYPAEVGTFAPYIRLLNRRGITLILTTGGIPRANAQDFEVILRVSHGTDGTAEALCEKGFSATEFQPFTPGARTVVALLLLTLEGAADK